MQLTEQNTGSQSDGHTLSEESPNSYNFLNEPIKGTPFNKTLFEGKWFITWGKWRLSGELEKEEEIEEYMEEQKWNLMCAYMIALQQEARKYDKLGETPPEEAEVTK